MQATEPFVYRIGLLTTPDHVLNEVPRVWPLLTPIGAERSALLFSETPDGLMSAVALAEYVILTVVLFVWFRRAENQDPQKHRPLPA